MRKFAFLLAIVAVFAMSACAFAANNGDVTALETATTITDQNNGAIANDNTNLFYFDKVPAAFKLGMNATVHGDGTTSPAINLKIMGDWDDTSYGTPVDSSKTTKAGGGKVEDAVFDISAADLSTEDTWYVGVSNSSNDDWEGALSSVKVVPAEVTFTASKTAVQLELTDKSASVEIAGNAGEGNTVVFDLATGTDGVEVDSANKAGIKVEIDATNKKKINITPIATAFTVGTSTITVKQKKATVTEGSLAGIVVAGLDSSAGTDIATITVTVLPAATASADINGQPKVEIISGDAKANVLISTDIEQNASEGAKAIAKSDDVLIYVDGTEMPTASKSYDIVVRTVGSKKFYDAIINMDYLNTLAPGEHKVFVGNITKTAPVRTDTVTITVIAPTPPPQTTSSDVTTAAQQAAIVQIIARDSDLGLTTATSHDANRSDVKKTDPANRSNDVRGYYSIEQTVPAGDYVAINGMTAVTASPSAGESITFYKNFGTPTDEDLVSLSDVTSGDELAAAVLIVDDVCPANLQSARKPTKTANANKGLTVRTATDGTKVVIIYDGNKNGTVLDPIEARVNRWHSSSSSCSMGFGLAAVAGLAALALRKRSK